LKKGKDQISKYEGEWATYLKCDDEFIWKAEYNQERLAIIEKMEYTLPSDSRFREDAILLANNYEEYAGMAKMYLEENQRNDKNLREKYKKEHNDR